MLYLRIIISISFPHKYLGFQAPHSRKVTTFLTRIPGLGLSLCTSGRWIHMSGCKITVNNLKLCYRLLSWRSFLSVPARANGWAERAEFGSRNLMMYHLPFIIPSKNKLIILLITIMRLLIVIVIWNYVCRISVLADITITWDYLTLLFHTISISLTVNNTVNYSFKYSFIFLL